MTRKDFNLLAETIRLLPSFDLPPLDTWGSHVDAVRFDVVVNRFADALRQTNPRFDAERFANACHGKRQESQPVPTSSDVTAILHPDTEARESVDLIASGYEFQCPDCSMNNKLIAVPKFGTAVECGFCHSIFEVGEAMEALS